MQLNNFWSQFKHLNSYFVIGPPLWKKMCQLKLLAKIKIFAWRACMNGLPTRLNLEKKGIRIDGSCPLCEKSLESIKHALIHCSKAQEVWWNWQTCPINLGVKRLDITDIALGIMENGTSLDLEIFFATTWSIWHNRNQVVHEHPCLPSSQVWGYAQRLRSDYKGAITANLFRQQPLDVGWAAPPPDTHKINVDGATSEDGRLSSVGVVIQSLQRYDGGCKKQTVGCFVSGNLDPG